MPIITPQGKTVKRIVVEIDSRGQCSVQALDLSGLQPKPMAIQETLIWLSKLVAMTLEGLFTQSQRQFGRIEKVGKIEKADNDGAEKTD